MPRPTNEARITGYLLANGKATQGSLRAALGLADSGITRALNNLIEQKVIKAGRPAADPVYTLVNEEKTRKAVGEYRAGQTA